MLVERTVRVGATGVSDALGDATAALAGDEGVGLIAWVGLLSEQEATPIETIKSKTRASVPRTNAEYPSPSLAEIFFQDDSARLISIPLVESTGEKRA